MGITDYGVNASSNTSYTYSTTSFLGTADINDLYTMAPGGSTWSSIQLNVVLKFTVDSKVYVYWLQDVSQIESRAASGGGASLQRIQFFDNIWNYTIPSVSSMSSSGIFGNGYVVTSSQPYYADGPASITNPGNNVSLILPATVMLQINSSTSLFGNPYVTFSYNDGFGWQIFDVATFEPTGTVGTDYNIVVDGSQKDPYGTFYDAELVMGGPNGGELTEAIDSNVDLYLEYFNGNNMQEVPCAYNFGTDTAETLYGATVHSGSVVAGTVCSIVYAHGGNLYGILTPLWDTANITVGIFSFSNVHGGSLSIEGQIYTFSGTTAELVLDPGTYAVDLGGATIASSFTLVAGFQNIFIQHGTSYSIESITSPASSAEWNTGMVHAIEWETSGCSSAVNIFLDSGTGKMISTIATLQDNDGLYNWSVPWYTFSTGQYEIYMDDASNSSKFYYSWPFTLYAPPYINVTSPVATSTWLAGGVYNITWNSYETSAHVDIDLDDSGFSYVLTLATNAPATGIFSCVVPPAGFVSGNYSILILDASDVFINGRSPLFFILGPPATPVLSPIIPSSSTSPWVALHWNAVANATQYEVFESTAPITEASIGLLSPIAILDAPQTSYMDYRFANGTFYYAILAYNGASLSNASNCQVVTILLSPVALNTYIRIASGDRFTYAFTVNSHDYPISTANGTYEETVLVDNMTATAYNVTIYYEEILSNATGIVEHDYGNETIGAFDMVTTGNEYFININVANKSYSEKGSSPGVLLWDNASWNNAGVATSLSVYIVIGGTFILVNSTLAIAAPPTDLVAAAGPDRVDLSWSAPAGGLNGTIIAGYDIFRGTSPGSEALVAVLGNVTGWIDTNLSAGQSYFYKVCAVNAAGEGPLSAEVMATAISSTPIPASSSATDVSIGLVAGIGGVVIVAGAISVYRKRTKVRV
jgi:hypothetical protein